MNFFHVSLVSFHFCSHAIAGVSVGVAGRGRFGSARRGRSGEGPLPNDEVKGK
jgi:hypothetical protein